MNYNFLVEGDVEKHQSLYFSYLKLGQWELCRSILKQLNKQNQINISLKLLENSLDINLINQWYSIFFNLSHLISVWMRSNSDTGILSFAHLTWLILLEYRDISFTLKTPITMASDLECKTALIEFNILLSSTLKDLGDSTAETLNSIYSISDYQKQAFLNKTEIEPSFSEATLSLLKNIFLLFPITGSSIANHLLSSDVSLTSRTLQIMFTEILKNFLEKHEFDQFYHYLQFLHYYRRDDIKQILTQLFNDVIYSQKNGKYKNNLVNHKIYSNLLKSDTGAFLLEFYTSLEDQFWIKERERTTNNSSIPEFFSKFSQDGDNSQFWYSFYHFVRSNNIHFGEYIISKSMELLPLKQFNLISKLLEPFPNMIPLFILSAWDKFKIQLLESKFVIELFGMYNKLQNVVPDPALHEMCSNLVYQTSLIWYLSDVFEKLSSTKPSLATILQKYEGSSVPFVIKDVINRIDLNTLLVQLEGSTDSSSQVQAQNNSDIDLTRSYLILNQVVTIYQTYYNNRIDLSQMDAISSYLRENLEKILEPSTKIKIIEILLSFIGLKFSDLSVADKDPTSYASDCKLATFIVGIVKSTVTSMQISEDNMNSRLNVLKSIVQELEWRINTLKALELQAPSSEYGGYVNLLMASVPTLFTIGLRKDKFEASKQILDSEKLNNSYQSILQSAMLADSLQKQLVSTKSEDISTVLQGSLPVSKIIQSSTIDSESYLLFDMLSLLPIGDYTKQLLDSILNSKQQKESETSQPIFTLLNKIMLGITYCNIKYIHDIFTSVESVPQTSDKSLLENQLLQNNSEFDAVQKLKDSLHGGKDSSSAILRQTVNLLSKKTELNQSKPFDYLLRFLKHILILGDILTESSDSSNYFDTLNTSPNSILKTLIFDTVNYKKAEDIASLLNLDLISIILSNNQAESGSDDKKIPTLDVTELLQLENSIDLQVVSYISRHSAPLAILVSILKLPFTNSINEFLAYAVSNSKEFPVLFNWICTKLHGFQLLNLPTHLNLTHGIYPLFTPSATSSVEPAKSNQRNSKLLTSISYSQLPLSPEELASLQDTTKFLELLINENVNVEQEFYVKMFKRLAYENKFEEALQLLESNQFSHKYEIDMFLQMLVDKTTDKTKSWRFIMRLKDKDLATHLIIKNVYEWDIATAIDMVYMCRCNLPEEHEVYGFIKTLYLQLTTLQKILQIESGYPSWKFLFDTAKATPLNVIQKLLELNQHETAKDIVQYFMKDNKKDISRDIEEHYLLYLLHEKEYDKSIDVLQTLESSCQLYASILSKLTDNTAKLVVVKFLIENPPTPSDEHESLWISDLHNQLTSLQIICNLPKDAQDKLSILLSKPLLIIESLIMSEFTIELITIFQKYPELTQLSEDLLVIYAKKAMSFSKPTQEEDVSTDPKLLIQESPSEGRRWYNSEFNSSSSNLKQKLWILTLDETTNEQLRIQHYFPSSPSINLTKSLLELTNNYKRAGETCIIIADELSTLVTDVKGEKTDNLLVLTIIQELLLYAKIQFLQGDFSDQSDTVDTYLGHLDLYQSLLIHRALPTGFALRDFSDVQKSKQLRDRLISIDRMKLAMNVATKCTIESDPVWFAWGLSLLRLGKFSDAKEKFNYCLVSVNDPGYSELKNNTFLNEIIEVLERSDNTIYEDNSLRQQYTALVNSMKSSNKKFASPSDDMSMESYLTALHVNMSPDYSSPSKRHSEAMKVPQVIDSLDSNRLMQCVFYLKRYGTPKALVRFWIKHRLLEDACQFVFSQQLPIQLFVEEILQYCISRLLLPGLLKAIRRIDPTMQNSRPYLDAACKYFNEKKAYSILLEFLVFLNDTVRAGLTYVKLFLEEQDTNLQLKYLEQAKTYFLDSITNNSTTGEKVLSEAEVSRYVKNVTLQIQITKYLQVHDKEKLVTNVSVFGSAPQRAGLAEHLLVLHEFHLAFQIIQEFRLQTNSIYSNAVTRIIKRKQANKVDDLLTNFKGTLSDKEWDEVILACITALTEEADAKTAEKLCGRLTSIENKVQAYIKLGKLKAAYLDIVRESSKVPRDRLLKLIDQIKAEAIKINQPSTVELCDKFKEKKV